MGSDRNLIVLEITEAASQNTIRVTTIASSIQRCTVRWDGDDAIYVDSSDVGMLRYERSADGWRQGEVYSRKSPDSNLIAKLIWSEERSSLAIIIRVAYGSDAESSTKWVLLPGSFDDFDPRFITRRGNENALTAQSYNWEGNDRIVIHMKTKDIFVSRKSGEWHVE
ncbi:MAG: hypothetical protein QM775_09945 [Pirellulales bacterium]